MNTSHRACRLLPAKARKTPNGSVGLSLTMRPWLYLMGAVLMTMALPPDYVDRLMGGQSGYTTADFDFQSRLLLFVQPTFGFLYPFGSQPNPVLMQRTKRWADLYKNFVRPFRDTGRIYHRTPEVAGLDPHGWGVLELDSNEGPLTSELLLFEAL